MPNDPQPTGRPAVDTERSYTLNKPEALLAHYTSAEVAFEHILPTNRLRMSPYRFMRDPVENKDIVPGTAAYGETPEDFDAAYRAALDGIKFLRDECRILSLTRDAEAERTFGCSWARPRMWEQYADNHRGVCLLFDGELLESVLATAFGEHNVLAWLQEVEYTPAGVAGSKLRFWDDQRIFDPEQRMAGFESDGNSAVQIEGDYAFVDYGDALVAVVVGERFPNWQLLGARRSCERTSAMFGKVGWYDGRPRAFPPVVDDRA